MFSKTSIITSLLTTTLFFTGCSSAGDEGVNRSAGDPIGGGGGGTGTGQSLIEFVIAVNANGQIDTSGRGVYAILLNARGTPIEATDLDTFTDVMVFDGRNFDWYHRLSEVPNPGFNFVEVGPLAGQAGLEPDGKTLRVVVDTADSTSFFNQYIPSGTFTTHVVTTDTAGGAFLGRLIDTLGQGPNINSNSLQTVTVQVGRGVLQPVPQSYPFDPLNDTVIHSDLDAGFPYANFDIARFEVTVR